MTLAEAQEDLAYVRAAIRRAYQSGGMISYSRNGVSAQKNLDWLTKERDRLERIVAQSQGGGFYAANMRPE